MSQANVEIVRRHTESYDGQDIADVIRDAAEAMDLEDLAAVSSAVAETAAGDPVWQEMSKDVVWDATRLGFASVARGIDQVVAYWYDWAGLWESYIYRVAEHRDLGDWVLTVTDVRARGRDGIDVAMRSFQAWEVRRGRITTMRACTSEAEALATIDAAGGER